MNQILYINFRKYICILLVSWNISAFGAVQNTDTLFHSDDVINLQIRTNFTEILAGRTEEPVEYEGVLVIKNHVKSGTDLSVKVSSRGNFRRDPKNCSFPPLRIDFRKKETENTLFHGQDKLKLVTPCQDDIDVLEEYLVYKMYGKVTDQSFKVRLALIEYYDTGKKKKLFERYSFFLEDEDHAAKRLGSAELKKFVTPFDLETEGFSNLAVFQFMIGNKDWYVTSRKNIVVMQPEGISRQPFAIPYDFDFSGFVNADYTRPPNTPLRYLSTRRVFKGICESEKNLMHSLRRYRELKKEFEQLIDEMKFLPVQSRHLGKDYLDEFYSLISDTSKVRKNLLETCETRSLYNLTSSGSEP